VILDDQFRSKNLSVGDDQIMEKYGKIRHAKAFIHLGTTMGLEACFTETPSLILDFPEFEDKQAVFSLRHFVHQYQNEKYLMQTDQPNVVRSLEQLKNIIRQLENGSSSLTAYNRNVVCDIPLKSFAQFAHDLVET
jgi:hypothetical protein